jgi:hypothetical protein
MNKAVVTRSTTELVLPLHENSQLPSTHHLGPLDVLAVPYVPISVLFVYESSQGQAILVDRFKDALRRTLNDYIHLTGRVVVDKKTGVPVIRNLGEGIEFVQAQCSTSLRDLQGGRLLALHQLPEEGNGLFPSFDYGTDMILAIQLTSSPCGSVALGVSMNHVATDAHGFFQFMEDLANTYRTADTDRKPVLRSYKAEEMERTGIYRGNQPKDFFLEGDERDQALQASMPKTSPNQTRIKARGRVLRLSKSELGRIKLSATQGDGLSWISTFDALTAYLMQKIHHARVSLYERDDRASSLGRAELLTPVNLRRTLGLGANSFPNATTNAIKVFNSELSNGGSLPAIALAVHKMTRKPSLQSKAEIDEALDWIASRPEKNRIKQDFLFRSGSFMLTQWNKIEMYTRCQFEEGTRPVLIAPPFTAISTMDGLGYYLPCSNVDEEGGVDVYLALDERVWHILDSSQGEPWIYI